MDISVVIPVYNEAENIVELWAELSPVLVGIARDYEVIFIDDGSTDDTYTALAELRRADRRVRVIRLRRNFGQTAAIAAGFDHAQGKVIVTMDADLQNDPQDIPRLVRKLDEGYDIVSGWRKHRQDALFTRRLPSRAANRLISFVTGVRLHDLGCTLKAYRREVAQNVNLYGELHRFIPVVASGLGIRIAELPVGHRRRRHGRSRYGALSRTLPVLLDLLSVKFLLGYSTRPLRFFGTFGFLLVLGGGSTSAYLGVRRIFSGIPMSDGPALMLGLLSVVLGVQLISLGLVAEIMTRLYYEGQGKRIYSVREVMESDVGEP